MAQKGTVLTGDRPTGKLHLGHLVGSIRNRIALEEDFEQFVMVADMQALTDNADNPKKVRDGVFEVTLDNIAAGLDPKRTTFFIQSQVPELAALAMLFQNLVSLGRLTQNPTVKTEMKEKGYGTDVPVGFLTYPISQAADILAFKPDYVPVGDDQLPMIELTNDIVEKFNRFYGEGKEIFKRVKAIVPEEGSNESRLPGIDGKAKMSKSLGNAIYLSDSPEEIKRKVMLMYTDPNHIRANDPGRVEGNVVFTYLSVFDSDKESLTGLKEQYQKGGLGDVEIKERLVKILTDLLRPIREKRNFLGEKPEVVMDILKEGSARARGRAGETLAEVKKAMKINYFE